MPATCAGCGDCCDPVVVEASVLDDARAFATGAADLADGDASQRAVLAGNLAFIAAHWQLAGPVEDDGWAPVRCDAFDPASRLCTARENRPPVCRDYPWYGREPSPDHSTVFSLRCSYLADLPPADRPEGARPLIPLAVING